MVAVPDLVVLLSCSILILIGHHHSSDLHWTSSWFIPIEPYHGNIRKFNYKNGVAPDITEKGPRPLITDIDGDGNNEIVLITREPKIKMFTLTPTASHVAQSRTTATKTSQSPSSTATPTSPDSLTLLAESDLLSSILLKSGRYAVSMASGYLHPYDNNRSRQQYIAILTDGLTVILFNHKLERQWEHVIDADLSHSFIEEVAILLDAHPMRINDTGVVMVGVKLANRKEFNDYHKHNDGAENENPNRFFGSTGDAEAAAEYQQKQVDEPDTETETLLNDRKTKGPQHFSFYAFEGLTGETRWKHEAGDFYEEVHATDILHPQHETHTGEVDWRNFRQDLANTLPHVWSHRDDTSFDLAHFSRRRSGQDRQSQQKQYISTSQLFSTDMSLTLRPHQDTEHVQKPNALVAHRKDGIEVVHLYSGRPLCRLSLQRDVVHVDVDGDGVIDHIETVAGSYTPHGKSRQQHEHQRLSRCMMLVTSGIPPSHHLFNSSICTPQFFNLFNTDRFPTQAGIGLSSPDATDADDEILVAHPIVLQEYKYDITQKHSKRWQSVFFVNNGLVSGFTHDGRGSWRAYTRASWITDNKGPSLSDAPPSSPLRGRVPSKESAAQAALSLQLRREAFLPSVTPYALQPDARQDHIIVAGESLLVLLTGRGDVTSDIKIQDLPITTPVVGDFNNDGWNDVVIVTTSGYYGFILHRSFSTSLFSILIGGVVIVLAIAIVIKYTYAQPSQVIAKRAAAPINSRRVPHAAIYKSKKNQE